MRIVQFSISGFKSILEEQKVLLGNLTIFAGANSGGKSSATQALLLLKQTLESQFDPGVLLLYGPNSKFTGADQIFSRGSNIPHRKSFTLGFIRRDLSELKVRYELSDAGFVRARRVDVKTSEGESFYYTETSEFDFDKLPSGLVSSSNRHFIESYQNTQTTLKWVASPGRCFPELRLVVEFTTDQGAVRGRIPLQVIDQITEVVEFLQSIIHVRGLRGNPERSYLATARTKIGFPGAFEDYVASTLLQWQREKSQKLSQLGDDLRHLGLTWKVRASPIEQTHAEIKVGRLSAPSQGGANDLVSLADVGLGVSQVLPFLVAMRATEGGQIIFIEQPEIHLHPLAQSALADLIADSVARGVRIWLETHSAVLIRALQTQIAKRRLNFENVAMNWFTRDSTNGATTVSSCVPDKFGRVRDWPADFDAVLFKTDRDYLDAVSSARQEGS